MLRECWYCQELRTGFGPCEGCGAPLVPPVEDDDD